jgi:hypothetical protein
MFDAGESARKATKLRRELRDRLWTSSLRRIWAEADFRSRAELR